MKKLFVVLLFLVSLTIVFASGKLVFWHTQVEENRQKVINQLAKTFSIETGIEVEVVAVEENEMFSKLAAAKAAGTLPDIIEAGAETILSLGADGLLDTILPTRFINNTDENFYEGAARFVRTPDGKSYYAIPFHGWVQGIWYRKDWFERAGLEPPITWDSILKAAKYFHNPDSGIFGIVLAKNSDSYAEQVFTIFALSNGARIFDENGNVVVNSPEMKETLEFYKELGKYSAPGHTYWKQARELYLQGKTAMFFYSTYIMDDLALAEVQTKYVGDFDPQLVKNTGFAPYMTHSRKSSFGQVVSLGVLNTTKNKLGAWKFLTFMFEPENYVKFLHMAPGGMLPTTKKMAESEVFMRDPKGIYERYGRDKIMEIIEGMSNVEKFGYVNGKVFPEMGKISGAFIIGKGLVKMFDENLSPEKVLKYWELEMKKITGK
ncbi:ABC transporter substrate-binding protein [Thermosipho atlanticus]|uniref:Carbohydrate ABC transporter substrate-binding protein, CUT1 family n=1 Tax=Thermosipho atlanticus DSM 15807 TaxID=1123380 RepID=A0A1M5T0L7_9BACT|nr:extracellular solute-binding protein [Thermosipho atlanticus]SHH44331.1 carbohydrate ABC transporter substrate-binding protein, CUT1 family [Thermosipho atlanticus DSM 15807]